MIRVAIIDDEPVIRRGIRTMVNWAMLGCEVCGDAADGAEGKTLIETCRPQIIITDIRMPGLDGLDMIRQVGEIVPESKIIILTGYRNFEYAQQAVRLGAFDLLTKPTKIEELNQIIQRAVAAIEAERRQVGQVDELRQSRQRDEPIVRERMLYHMMVGTDTAGAENAAVRERLRADLSHYALGLFEMGRGAPAAQSQPAWLPRMLTSVRQEFAKDFTVLCIGFGTRSAACVIRLGEKDAGWKERAAADWRRACARLAGECGETPAAAFSDEGRGAETLPDKLRECQTALEYTFILGRETVVFYSDLQTYHIRDECADMGERQNRLLAHIRSGSAEAAAADGREIAAAIRRVAKLDRKFADNFYFDTILRIYSLRRAPTPGTGDGLNTLRGMIERCENPDDLDALIGQIIRRECERARRPESAPGWLLRKAMAYIDAHYREDISLADVAAAIYASPCYTSHLFKKELGVNFVDYLNASRMKRAKEMLADSHYKIYEVAEAVGIPNEHYFSKLFKRYFGMTASEYRQDAG